LFTLGFGIPIKCGNIAHIWSIAHLTKRAVLLVNLSIVQHLTNAVVIRRTVRRINSGFCYSLDENYLGSG